MSPPDPLQPFNSTMEEFLGWARKTIQDQFDFLCDFKRRFVALVNYYYCYRGNGVVVCPSEFFEL